MLKIIGYSLLLSLLSFGCTIEIPDAPIASFTIGNNNCIAPCQIGLTNTSQHATSYLWDMGDGTTFIEESPIGYTYTKAGEYKVKLIAKGLNGSSGTTQLITIKPGSLVAPTKQWDKTYGGNADDFPSQIINTNDGGFLVVGSSKSGKSGDKSDVSRGDTDYWIVKLNASGVKVWDKTYGGSGEDIPASVMNTTDGGYIIVGYSASNISGNKSEDSKGVWDFWVIKLNPNGNKVWDKTIGGNKWDFATSVVATLDGGIVVAGNSESDISGDKVENGRGAWDYWIIKVDANGKKVWDKTIGASHRDETSTIVSTPDGGILVAGSSESHISGDKTD